MAAATVAGAAEMDWTAVGQHGAVSAGGREAVAAGMEILKQGGNAVDAAVGTLLALSVTDSEKFCLGGEVPILVYDAKRKVVEVIGGQGVAPRLATRERFAEKGIPNTGPQSATVPGALDACITALDRYGTITLAQAAAPTLRLLDRGGKDWHPRLAATLRRLMAAEQTSAGDRSRGLRLAADCFYRGPIARDIDQWSRESGGLLRYSDLATYVTRIEEPAHATYRGFTVYKCGAWTQGPCLLEALKMLEGIDLKSVGGQNPRSTHAIVEAMKLALADRDVYYGDPLFADVPVAALLLEEYAAIRRPLIDMKAASLAQRPGDPRGMRGLLEAGEARRGLGGPSHDTTTCLTADQWGNVVAATPSGWGGAMAGDSGVRLGSRLQSFNTWEGHPNCIEPGKRPRITLSPTLVMKEDKVVLAISVAGGDAQDQATAQMITDYIDFGASIDQVVTRPRYMTEHLVGSFRQPAAKLGNLKLGLGWGQGAIGELKNLGHRVESGGAGPEYERSVIEMDAGTGQIRAAGDPAGARHAGAF